MIRRPKFNISKAGTFYLHFITIDFVLQEFSYCKTILWLDFTVHHYQTSSSKWKESTVGCSDVSFSFPAQFVVPSTTPVRCARFRRLLSSQKFVCAAARVCRHYAACLANRRRYPAGQRSTPGNIYRTS